MCVYVCVLLWFIVYCSFYSCSEYIFDCVCICMCPFVVLLFIVPSFHVQNID